MEVQENCLTLAFLHSKNGFEWVRGRISFGPPTLKRQSFAALWAMIMNSSSIEGPKHSSTFKVHNHSSNMPYLCSTSLKVLSTFRTALCNFTFAVYTAEPLCYFTAIIWFVLILIHNTRFLDTLFNKNILIYWFTYQYCQNS